MPPAPRRIGEEPRDDSGRAASRATERDTTPTPQPDDVTRADAPDAQDPDLDRIRVLIARCFSPTVRSSRNMSAGIDAMAKQGRHARPSTHPFARLQRLL